MVTWRPAVLRRAEAGPWGYAPFCLGTAGLEVSKVVTGSLMLNCRNHWQCASPLQEKMVLEMEVRKEKSEIQADGSFGGSTELIYSLAAPRSAHVAALQVLAVPRFPSPCPRGFCLGPLLAPSSAA